MKSLSPNLCFLYCKLIGFGLLLGFWLLNGETAGFFLLLLLICMSLLRWRVPKLNFTVVFDIIVCAALSALALWAHAPFALAISLFAAMYFGFYWAAIAGAYIFLDFDPPIAAALALAALCGVFLGLWTRERRERLEMRDKTAGRYYELEGLQSDLAAALVQIERMTAVAERTRISRDIHDNAGHEIIAAYISLQTAREMMDGADAAALELYDAALERLSAGADKIRDAVHNLSAVTALGVEALQDICRRFPACDVAFRAYGDTSKIPIYVWQMLETCLNESLTNVARHSAATRVTVDLDVTPHIVRLCIENDGTAKRTGKSVGTGLRNLRHRAAAIGGNLSATADMKGIYRVICVIPAGEGEK